MSIIGGRDGMGGPCGKERAHEDVRAPEKPERAHMQAQGDMEGRDAVEGGEDMKSTKRFKAALAMLLVVALSPFAGALAFGAGENATSSGTTSGQGGESGAGVQGADVPATLSAGDATAVADGNTASTWRDWGLENSTENVGRIWTDKTVQAGDITLTGAGGEKTIPKGDSTFLTALSAISSTSNLKSTSTTPLDIVLVLDASGSMDDPMGSGDSTKRIDALKEAANSFVDEIANQNAGVSDVTKQHQVAIVKFAGNKTDRSGNETYRYEGHTYNYSQVMKSMTACTGATKADFKTTIDSIAPAGATRSDFGMELAEGQKSNRDEAKKIVIFFTDGKPTSFSDYNPAVAKGAIDAAKAMKDAGASVYTIGIFEGVNTTADPTTLSDTDWWGNPNEENLANKFMQAASSNYPNATYTSGRGGYSWNFGTRADNADFYKSATNADELKKVFDDISKEIVQGAGYPTETKDGYEDESGWITFTDQLGDYMQVDGFTNIVFANQVFENPAKTTNGQVDTYTFTGKAGTALYPDGDLSDIDITVTHSQDLRTGDKVEVKIPAGLIPLRAFTINENGTGSVALTFPIRLFYGSSLKAGVAAELANPGAELAAYIADNAAGGKVNFLANKWSGGADGDVVANFTPSKGNSYYYITADTPIYQDEACTQRAKAPLEQGKTYYYQRTWYDINSGKATQQSKVVSFNSGVVENIDGYIEKDANGEAYFKAGTPRMTYINELNTKKGEDKSKLSANNTGTAETFINPKWAAEQVNVLLGNNGKLSVEQPGTLAVSKQLQVPEGYTAADFADEEFEFAISVPDAKDKSFDAVVKNAAGEQQGDAFKLAFDGDGKATHSLKPGETLYAYGLSAGWKYEVTEAQKDGYSQVASETTGLEGVIAAGQTSEAKVTNTYEASGTLNGETSLAGEKVLTGRSWQSEDKFAFLLKGVSPSADIPMPEGSSGGVARMEVTQSEGAPAGTSVPFRFGDITYTQPGTYVYEIHESTTDSRLLPGVSASNALYQVTVMVEDKEHNGNLTVESAMKQLKDDAGVLTGQAATVAKFTNEYNTGTEKWAPIGAKTYTDNSGANPLTADMFHVAACTDDPYAPLPDGAEIMLDSGGKQWHGVVTSVEASGGIAFPQATYSFKDLKGQNEKTFTYKLVEVVQVDGVWVAAKDVPNHKLDGMQYDPTVWTAAVTIKNVDNTLELSVAYSKDGGGLEAVSGGRFAFENAYNPDPAVLDGTAAISGTKVLTGRDMAQDETFGFKLSAADDVTQKAVDDGNIVIPEGANEAAVSGAKAEDETKFSFGEMTFSKPGTYSFAVQETKYCGNTLDAAGAATGGIVFDRHVHKVTVKVTDDHKGKLVAEVSYDNGSAKFENKYEQNAQFSGITVQKTLNGRGMAADEFSFSIHGVDKDGAVAAAEAEKRLAVFDRSFTNAARADGVACDMAKMQGVTFTQDDIGKTFAYEVREVVPAAADAKPGVSYDDSVHTLEITVGMSGDADKRLTLTTKLDGEVIDLATKPVAVAFTNGYQATPTSYDTATAGLNKVLEGRNWTDSDNFTFELKALDGGPLPKDAAGKDVTTATVTKANAESFGFGTIEFTSDMVKAEPDHKRTFTYEVREVVPADGHKLPGIQYDDNVATIKVTVSDDGSGMLKASAVAENTRFVNRYAAEIDYTAAGGLNVAKTLTGRDMAEGQFTIKVTPGDEASAYALGLPLEGAEIAMPAAADGAQAVKSALGEQHVVLRQSDVGKTYTYKVVEAVGEKATGYTYDTTEYTVTVTVEDNPQRAALTVETVVAGGPEGTKTYVYGADPSAVGTGPAVVPFANAYAASTDNPGGTAAQVTAIKALMGRPLSAGEFTFAVKYATGGDDLRTAENAADGTVTFDGLHYTTEMLEGLVKDGDAYKTSDQGVISWTVSYLAYEKTDGLAGQGITAQTQPIPFTVTVVDNGDGSLTATANLDKGLKFENAYSTGDSVQVGLSGVKTLQAAPGLDPASIEGKFTFTVISDDAAAPMPERTTAKNAADGSVDFGTIEFTLDDLNRALGVNDQTAIADADKAEADAAKAADQAAAPAKEADADAAKAADADASKAAADADKAAADADSASAKAADDGDKPAAGDKQVAGAVAAPDTANGTVDEVAPGNQPADQPANPEPESGKPRSHVFAYKVTESGSVPGVINDAAATKTVSFKVTDDGAGKLTVERQGDAATPAFSFANTYTVEPANSSVTDQVTVTKTLTGRDMAAGEFAFELLEGEDVVATGVNAADGSVALSAVKYTQPGTHHYTLHEVGGGTIANGVTYDGATYTVVTTVKDNGDGTLSVAHALEGAGEATFANAYQATSTTVTIGATKTLVGKNLENGQFTFVLTAADGTELKAKNAADGKIAFPTLTFDKPGTYEFALTELDDAQANVTYDKRAYKVTVTVVDGGLGHLNATVAGDADVLAFTNTYAEPPAPVQPAQPGGKTFTPSGLVGKVLTQTGDDKLALVLPLAAVALAGAASIATLVIMRRRDKR